MTWTKTTIRISRWEWPAAGFRITETIELDGSPFTLENMNEPDQEPSTFGNLKQAQQHAELLNRLNLEHEENVRLRSKVQDYEAAEAFERNTRAQKPAASDQSADETELEADVPEDDGRGIPQQDPVMTLKGSHAWHEKPEINRNAPTYTGD